jgi:AcrR family transcriptional regulator
MGIKERQTRDRETMRRAILDAARELFVAEGYGNVSIRKIAERIEYSPAAIYGYFPSKDDIFFALAEEGFRLLCDRGAALRPESPAVPPLDRIRAIFWRLYEFSREHPQYFDLMFVDRAVPRISREYQRFAFAREMKGNIVQAIQDGIDAGVLPRGANPAAVMRMMTVGILGIAVLRLSERLTADENADALAADMLDVTLAGLQSGIALHSGVGAECPLDEELVPVMSARSLSVEES